VVGMLVGLLPGLGPLATISLLLPLTFSLPPGGAHWYAVYEVGHPDPVTFAPTYAEATAWLDSLPYSSVWLGGFSQGCAMAYALALFRGRRRPDALLAMSGFIPTVPGVWEADLGSRKNLPVMIAHGELDPVISVEFGREARDRLIEAGLDVENGLHEFLADDPELAELARERGIRLPPALTGDWPPRLSGTDERGWFRFQRLYDTARSVLRGPDDGWSPDA